MLNRRTVCLALGLAPLVAHAASKKNMSIIVPYPPGGPLDNVARLLGDAIKPIWGKTVINNIAGGAGARGMLACKNAAADGKTLVMGAVATLAINPLTIPNLPYKSEDFKPVTLLSDVPNVLVVTPSTMDKFKVTSAKNLIDFIKNNDKVIPYFDVPIQHSEDHLLKRMNRRGYKDYLLDLFKKIKREIPHAILRTTIIVGFSGETDEDIKNLLDFMDEVKFDHLGAFTFSPEEGTKALEYNDVVSEDDKNRRYNLVMAKQKDISLAHMESYLNKELEVFITGYDEESYFYLARNDIFASDDIDGVIYVAAKDEHNFGDVIKIKVLDCDAYTLTGEEI